ADAGVLRVSAFWALAGVVVEALADHFRAGLRRDLQHDRKAVAFGQRALGDEHVALADESEARGIGPVAADERHLLAVPRVDLSRAVQEAELRRPTLRDEELDARVHALVHAAPVRPGFLLVLRAFVREAEAPGD